MKKIKEMENYAWAKKQADKWNTGLIKAKKELKLSNDRILAMSPANDPYWMTPAKLMKAKWAEEIMEETITPHLERIGVRDIHLRDIHYTLTSSELQETWDGERYLNTVGCWSDLIKAFAVARYTGLIDWRLIRDNKNILYQRTRYGNNKTFMGNLIEGKDSLTVDNIIYETLLFRFGDMLNPWNWMPIHIEIWTEKDLALLELICSKHKVNMVVGEGETSITQVFQLVERIRKAGKPTRIAYIADCDVVGSNMSKAMARKLEFLLNKLLGEEKRDVKVIPLMLTPTQVDDYGLPTIPMKPSKSGAYETRKDQWLASRGMDGAVEVNAFHALYPDDFKFIVESFISSYKDEKMWKRVKEFNGTVRDFVREQIDCSNVDISSLIKAIESVDWVKVEKEYHDNVDEIGESELSYGYKDQKYRWLLDTERNYFEQLWAYNRYENGEL